MNKLKVILVNKNMAAGGIETAVLAFMENLKESIDIDLVLFNKCGAFVDRIPNDINVIEGGKILKLLGNTYAGNPQQKTTSKLSNFKKKILKTINKFGGRKILSNFAFIGQKQKTYYDVAVCCDGVDELKLKYVLKCTTAKYKVAFIHCDVFASYISKKAIKMLEQFDKVLCVSKSCAELFKKRFPQFNNVDYLYNFQDIPRMLQLSNAFNVEYKQGFNMVTVARLSNQKAHMRSLRVLKKLNGEGYKFIWNIVGDGENKEEIETFIKENQMEDYVIMHGLQANPYPYIKKADLFYLATNHEAAPMVYAEAMSLHVPVFTTNTCSADELVGDLGFVCENNEQGIYKSLKEIFNNLKIVEEKKNNLKDYAYNNKDIANKFLTLFKKDYE